MSVVGLRDLAYIALIAALVLFQARRGTSNCASENEDILAILRDLAEGQKHMQQTLEHLKVQPSSEVKQDARKAAENKPSAAVGSKKGESHTTLQSEKILDSTESSPSKEEKWTSGNQEQHQTDSNPTHNTSLPLYSPANAEPGGVNCSLAAYARADGGTTYAISPLCYPFPFLNIHVWESGFSSAMCERMITAAEDANKWTRKSHYLVGEDVGVDEIELQDDDVGEIEDFVGRLNEFITKHFVTAWPTIDGQVNQKKKPGKRPKIDYNSVATLKGTPFIIRYDANTGNPGLQRHKDNTDVSFIVLLSDPDGFTGGGTNFDAMPDHSVVPMRRGEALVFNGQLVHGALPITAGRRYVLSGFINFNEKFWITKRTATLATSMHSH